MNGLAYNRTTFPRSWIAHVLLAILTLLVAGCASKGIVMVAAYDTSRFSESQTATLHVPSSLSIWDLDGEDLNIPKFGYEGAIIRMGPGEHKATVYYGQIGGSAYAVKQFTLPTPDDYFIGYTLNKVKAATYVNFHVYKCGSAEEEKLKQDHNASSYRKYKNACPIQEL